MKIGSILMASPTLFSCLDTCFVSDYFSATHFPLLKPTLIKVLSSASSCAEKSFGLEVTRKLQNVHNIKKMESFHITW
jgi:hypothetical protein